MSQQSTHTEWTDLESTLALHLVPGLGPRLFDELIQKFGSATAVLGAAPSQLAETPGVGPKLVRSLAEASSRGPVDEQLVLCRENAIELIHRTHESYPVPLKEIYDPPPLLFCRGELVGTDAIAIAIVGARHATHYGKSVADRLARGLASAGFTIVSGLARGIDAAAHRGALEAGGRTIAVLGGGILNLYPAEHEGLAGEISGQGALLSEALPRSAPKSGSFPRRNRIISGLSLGVICVEAGERSGALISARLASEQGREVFAVPGRIDSRMSRGCHRLIRDGAKLVENIDDVLEELGPLARPATDRDGHSVRHAGELKLTEQESRVLNAIDIEPTDFDTVVERTGLPAARVLSTISVLEIRRLIRRLGGTRLTRI